MKVNEVRCHPEWHMRSVAIYVLGPQDNLGRRLIGREIVGDSLADDFAAPAPTMRLDMDVAQQLMDELWRAGMRPTEGSGSAGSLAATEKHLADMRAIVSKQLDVQLCPTTTRAAR